jgi:uncharacterized membrane protein
MDVEAIWEWLRPMVGFFFAGVLLVLLVYVVVRRRSKKDPGSTAEK